MDKQTHVRELVGISAATPSGEYFNNLTDEDLQACFEAILFLHRLYVEVARAQYSSPSLYLHNHQWQTGFPEKLRNSVPTAKAAAAESPPIKSISRIERTDLPCDTCRRNKPNSKSAHSVP